MNLFKMELPPSPTWLSTTLWRKSIWRPPVRTTRTSTILPCLSSSTSTPTPGPACCRWQTLDLPTRANPSLFKEFLTLLKTQWLEYPLWATWRALEHQTRSLLSKKRWFSGLEMILDIYAFNHVLMVMGNSCWLLLIQNKFITFIIL